MLAAVDEQHALAGHAAAGLRDQPFLHVGRQRRRRDVEAPFHRGRDLIDVLSARTRPAAFSAGTSAPIASAYSACPVAYASLAVNSVRCAHPPSGRCALSTAAVAAVINVLSEPAHFNPSSRNARSSLVTTGCFSIHA